MSEMVLSIRSTTLDLSWSSESAIAAGGSPLVEVVVWVEEEVGSGCSVCRLSVRASREKESVVGMGFAELVLEVGWDSPVRLLDVVASEGWPGSF